MQVVLIYNRSTSFKGGEKMAREEDNHVEVIDPNDRRYKDDDYFNHSQPTDRAHYSVRYRYGCGCPFGCLSSIVISILLSIIFTFLLNWVF